MSELTCQSSDCDQRATMHFTRIAERSVIEETHLCNSHGRLHFWDLHDPSSSRTGLGAPLVLDGGVAFDVDFLFLDDLLDRPWGRNYVQLIEIGGHRRIGFVAGSCECGALKFELCRCSSPRPLTYQSMTAALSALGGELQFVEIDKYLPTQQIYEAKLHIRQMNTDVVVDVRPSDALVLAVICDVPIIVSESVLALMAQGQQ